MYNSVPKGTSQAEATLNSEKINPIDLTVVELTTSFSLSVSYSVEFLLNKKFKIL